MGIGLVGGLFDGIVEFITDFFGSMFDVIPKSIYLLAAVFLSVVDVLQCLVRKLAGLDVYWTTYSDGAVVQKDPLTEFIYGILGYGNEGSVASYKGLNTVFLSLAVFAVICLVVTSMIAIIKSHYNEDVAGTSPWKYIYTAIKAVFTFAIVPFVTVIGLKLSSWMLQTLDGIIASSATDEAMTSMYGETAGSFESGYIGGLSLEELPPEHREDPTAYYARYDMLGFGFYTTSTPFSGMLFRACAYTGNRARNDEANGDQNDRSDWCHADSGEGIVYFGGSKGAIFGKGNGINLSSTDKAYWQNTGNELVAQQVDYAFMNNLKLNSWQGMGSIRDMDAARYFATFDVVMPIFIGMNSFSKFHVGLVWEFYDLWQYNFIVAFAGGTTMVGIMLSVIIGLMSRLLKSAILFLIYPSLLGIAPLDNFKAFKNWTTQFIQQVMMAFGAIIGMNLTLLILPYANYFKFFNIGLIDALVNCIIVITGLMMMKDIIAMISNFAGGADANAAGSALKGEVGKAFAGGAKTTAKLGLKATKFAVQRGTNMVRKVGKATGDTIGRGARAQRIKNTQKEIDALTAKKKMGGLTKEEQQNLDKLKEKQTTQVDAFNKRYNKNIDFKPNSGKLNTHGEDLNFFKQGARGSLRTIGDDFVGIGKSIGKTWTRATTGVSDMLGVSQANEGYAMTRGEDGKAHYFKYNRNEKGEYLDKDGKVVEDKSQAAFIGKDGKAVEKITEAAEVDAKEGRKYNGFAGGFFQFAGNKIKTSIDSASMGKAGKELADGFLKGLTDISSSVGLDKMLKGMSDIFKEGTTFKGGAFDKSDKKSGDDLSKSLHEQKEAKDKQRSDDLKKKIEDLGDIIKEELPKSLKVAVAEGLKGVGFTASGTGSGTSKP